MAQKLILRTVSVIHSNSKIAIMKTIKKIGVLLIAGAIGVFIPYTIHQGGSTLIFTWRAFAILGVTLLIAYIKIGQLLDHKFSFIKWMTTSGIISGVLQIIGLLRWVFVVPVIAGSYVVAADPVAKQIAISSFQLIHQFGGVLLGEHIGQLFTVTYTITPTLNGCPGAVVNYVVTVNPALLYV